MTLNLPEKVWLRLVGDVHGHMDYYIDLTKTCEYSLQVGDLSLKYDKLSQVDHTRHKFIGGNHDGYDVIETVKHHLGNFGTWTVPEFGEIFFVRGAWSIDAAQLTPGKNWWPEEQLTMQQCYEALELYAFVKPRMLVSHECPLSIVNYVSDPSIARSFGHTSSAIPTRTNQLLDAMAELHRPELHIFGHYHNDVEMDIEGTRYICLGELETLDLPKGFLLS